MGKFISNFDTTAELIQFSGTTGFGKPHVSLTKDDSKIHYFEDPFKGHQYVDLGLESGTLWATMNVGATSETDAGLYFQWGDTQGYTADQVGSGEGQKYFGWADYKYGNGTESPGDTGMTKYNATDGKTVLDLEDDAVAANWGGDWHMPTIEQCRELLNTAYCTNTWTTVNGVNGYLFTSVKNGNTLFIPAAGSTGNGHIGNVGIRGIIWSSSLYLSVRYGRDLGFTNDEVYDYYATRGPNGFPVRGVIG